jgi:hypothetical protein
MRDALARRSTAVKRAATSARLRLRKSIREKANVGAPASRPAACRNYLRRSDATTPTSRAKSPCPMPNPRNASATKNPHAVALGRLGGAKGGPARAKALSARRRSQIAKRGAAARARSLSANERRDLARRAAAARWTVRSPTATAAAAPAYVRRVLRRYDPKNLSWAKPDHRYVIVREILLSGDARAVQWLRTQLSPRDIRDVVQSYRGAGCSDPERQQLRRALRLTMEDVPPSAQIDSRLPLDDRLS